MAYVEPCCIDRQLPLLLKNQAGGFAFFQTNGDVLIDHLIKAVGYMAGEGQILLLCMPQVDMKVLRMMNLFLNRGWAKAVMLLTQSAQEELIAAELADHLDRIHYACDPMVLDGFLAILPVKQEASGMKNEGRAVIIQGPMLSEQDFSLCLYAAWVGTDKQVMAGALDSMVAKLKTKARIDNHEQADITTILNREIWQK